MPKVRASFAAVGFGFLHLNIYLSTTLACADVRIPKMHFDIWFIYRRWTLKYMCYICKYIYKTLRFVVHVSSVQRGH